MISTLMYLVITRQVVSKLKFEFELVCSVRSFRLRTPSAQAPLPQLTTTHYSLATAHYLLLTTYRLLLTAYCLLLAACF